MMKKQTLRMLGPLLLLLLVSCGQDQESSSGDYLVIHIDADSAVPTTSLFYRLYAFDDDDRLSEIRGHYPELGPDQDLTRLPFYRNRSDIYHDAPLVADSLVFSDLPTGAYVLWIRGNNFPAQYFPVRTQTSDTTVHVQASWQLDVDALTEDLTLSRGTWEILEDVRVPEGVTLRINAGSELRFHEDAGFNIDGGSFELQSGAPVRFTGFEGDYGLETWRGIRINTPDEPCQLRDFVIMDADTGLSVRQAEVVIISDGVIAQNEVGLITGGDHRISRIWFYENEEGFIARDGESRLEEFILLDNTLTGVRTLSDIDLFMENCWFENGQTGLFIGSGNRGLVQQNLFTGIDLVAAQVESPDSLTIRLNTFYNIDQRQLVVQMDPDEVPEEDVTLYVQVNNLLSTPSSSSTLQLFNHGTDEITLNMRYNYWALNSEDAIRSHISTEGALNLLLSDFFPSVQDSAGIFHTYPF